MNASERTEAEFDLPDEIEFGDEEVIARLDCLLRMALDCYNLGLNSLTYTLFERLPMTDPLPSVICSTSATGQSPPTEFSHHKKLEFEGARCHAEELPMDCSSSMEDTHISRSGQPFLWRGVPGCPGGGRSRALKN